MQESIHSKQALAVLLLVSATASLTACGGDCDICDGPRVTRDWMIELDLGYIPDEITAYPIEIDVEVEVRSLENGGPAPDGLVVQLAVDPGSFVGGESSVERSLLRGRAGATLVADAAGTYRLTASIEGEERVARLTFTIGD